VVSHEQAIARPELPERTVQGGVGCRLFAVVHEVAGDEDQRRVAVVRVDVCDRRLEARIRIEAEERLAQARGRRDRRGEDRQAAGPRLAHHDA
jgi:hypothetical protein